MLASLIFPARAVSVVLLAAALGLPEFSASYAQTVLRVDADAPPGGDGTSWPTAFDDLAAALETAADIPEAVEIWVAGNTYRPDGGTGDVARFFDLPADVRLLGGFAGDETAEDQRDPSGNETILSGDLLGDDAPDWGNRSDNSLQILRASDLPAQSLIDGFTFSGGNADFPGGDFLGGGAIFAERSDVEVRQCLFVENTAGTLEPSLGNFGGAIYVKGYGTLTVEACRFERNRGNAGGAIGTIDFDGPIDVLVSDSVFDRNDVPTQSGGAIRFVGRALVIENSEFVDQRAGYGGAIHTTLAERVEVRECTFARNIADVKNAALWLERSDDNDATPAVLDGCDFLDNWTDGGGRGGTIHLEETVTRMTDCTFRGNFNVRENPITHAIEGSGTVTVQLETGHEFRNCLFTDNVAGFIGGVELIRAGIGFINCDFAGNRAASTFAAAAGVAAGESSFTVDNTILWSNRIGVGVDDDMPGTGGESAQISLSSSALAIRNSLVEGWSGALGGSGNIGDDPLFVDEAGGNLRLTEGSPAVDSGGNGAVPPDLPEDLDGNPRIADGDGDDVAVVDMGVYELGGVAGIEASIRDVVEGPELFPPRFDGKGVRVRYRLAAENHVVLAVFDVRGRRIRRLEDGVRAEGEHVTTWDGTDAAGRRAASGSYFVRLVAGEAVRSQRFFHIR